MKIVRYLFISLTFLFFAIGLTLLAYFFANHVLHAIHNIFIGLSYLIGTIYLVLDTGVFLVYGRNKEDSKKFNSYQDLDISNLTLKIEGEASEQVKAVVKKKSYETSSAVWFYMLFIWLTPLLCTFHNDFRFAPMNAFSALALISGLYLYFRRLYIVINRFGDAYTKPIPEKSPIVWFLLKLFTITILDLYYVAVLLVSFGIVNATTFITILK